MSGEGELSRFLAQRSQLLLSEFKLAANSLSYYGVYLFPEKGDLGKWHGFLLVKAGVFKGAKVKFILEFPQAFPKNSPELKLLTKLFHPVVADDGRVDVEALVGPWSYGERCQVMDLLARFQKIFTDLTFLQKADSFNPAAASLFQSDPLEYLQRCTRDSEASVAEWDKHYQGCPYAHKSTEVPQDVMDILSSTTIGQEEKKARLKELLQTKVNSTRN